VTEAELIMAAWGIIANAGGGDWTTESHEWQRAAENWRSQFHAWLDNHPLPPESMEES
jgi:hypothetical protein